LAKVLSAPPILSDSLRKFWPSDELQTMSVTESLVELSETRLAANGTN
jgi:hypothetical protein